MTKWKGMISVFMLVLLLLPCIAVAGQAPSVQDQQQVGDAEVDVKDGVAGQVDNRGRVSWFQNLFWYQIYALLRWVERWSVFV